MKNKTCRCAYMEQMIQGLKEARASASGAERVSLDCLLDMPEEGGSCCLLMFLAYHRFCVESTHSLREEAEHLLDPLMAGCMVSDEEERAWQPRKRAKR